MGDSDNTDFLRKVAYAGMLSIPNTLFRQFVYQLSPDFVKVASGLVLDTPILDFLKEYYERRQITTEEIFDNAKD